ncbi:hypothetical protein JAAARDRAFT_52575 [Jaapia argillacea MUCL 33604]|uniref:Uncharacterized protein n=1 Tax=Jaapia argillacea MUCL 33604 TaxID=933084 RepID=A0A067QCE7_9AGAM|nr:hypothetical protein JAAARDRAFT_52575 [Jaapia argillacea MUCL 33604]
MEIRTIPGDEKSPGAIYLTIPPRFYILPVSAFVAGSLIGLVRGSRAASLRFLAENAHRAPKTLQGWYFYQKTKNYKVLLGGLKGAGIEGAKLSVITGGWVGIEEGCRRVGMEEFGEVGAGVGTAALFAGVYRLPWRAAGRAMVLGLMIGGIMKGLKWGKEQLRDEAQKRAVDLEEAVNEDGREGVGAATDASPMTEK